MCSLPRCGLDGVALRSGRRRATAPTGVDRYEYDFSVVTEIWHASDLGDDATFSRADDNVAQSLWWYNCQHSQYC